MARVHIIFCSFMFLKYIFKLMNFVGDVCTILRTNSNQLDFGNYFDASIVQIGQKLIELEHF